MANNIYLASKPRYEILDGMRGVASILVMCFHLTMAYNFSRVDTPLGHVSMAVDFFFLLSGYVIGCAYDNRWDRMSVWNSRKRRLVRLHPMIIMGTLVGTVLSTSPACTSRATIVRTSLIRRPLACSF